MMRIFACVFLLLSGGGGTHRRHDYFAMAQPDPIIELGVASFKEMLDDPTMNWFDVIVDVRSLNEWEDGHIAGATLVENLASFGNDLSMEPGTFGLSENVGAPSDLAGCDYCNIVVYGNSADRAERALEHLIEAGFMGRLYNGQSVSEWTDAGYPLVVGEESVTPPCTEYWYEDGGSKQCRMAYLAEGGMVPVPGPATPPASWEPTTWDAIQEDANGDFFAEDDTPTAPAANPVMPPHTVWPPTSWDATGFPVEAAPVMADNVPTAAEDAPTATTEAPAAVDDADPQVTPLSDNAVKGESGTPSLSYLAAVSLFLGLTSLMVI